MLSSAGLEAIKRREGVLLAMYRDSAGLPTIGVGHLLTKDELTSGKLTIDGEWHTGITAEVADALLREDLMTAEEVVTVVVTVPLSQAQFDTLVSFVFNVGGSAFRKSTLVRLLNAGDYAAVPGQLRRWIFSAGQRDRVLERRREDEIDQWMAA